MSDFERFRRALEASWSLDSSSKWTALTPAAGQCGVTALVVQDHLGGDILKTRYGTIWHFYNRIDGQRLDFTESQFDKTINYDDRLSNRAEAFDDTNATQYGHLSSAIEARLAAEKEENNG